MPRRTYTHITIEERYQIKALYESGASLASIAKQLGRSASTISRQVRAALLPDGRLSPRRVERRYQASRKRSGRTRRVVKNATWQKIRKHLRQKHSPEQIAGRLARTSDISVSYSSIYRRLRAEMHKDPCIRYYLRRGGKRYNYGKKGRSRIPGRVDIRLRPKIVEQKQRMGDWEADTVIGKGRTGALVTLVDRASKYTLMCKVKDTKSHTVIQAIISMLTPYKDRVHTITYDNGAEFTLHQRVNELLHCQSYFATPYHSWERGLNEHTNGLIRQYLHKRKPFTHVGDAQCRDIQNALNNRPRKILNYQTPKEIFIK